MRKFTDAVVNFMKREDGPTAVEYAVMLALIIVVCLAAITTLGQKRQHDVHDRWQQNRLRLQLICSPATLGSWAWHNDKPRKPLGDAACFTVRQKSIDVRLSP